MEFSDLVHERRSVKSYDSSRTVSDEELYDLFQEAVLSPSSFNLQHWQFIAVRDAGRKAKMKAAAYGQPQVGACSVAILVCGKLNAHEDAPRIYAEAPDEVRERVLPMIDSMYAGNEQFQRDEAIRGATLAAMTLMLAAKNRGLDTGPMIGFDPQAMATLLELTPNYVPVMLVVLGREKDPPVHRAYRRPISEVVRLDTLTGPGLQPA